MHLLCDWCNTWTGSATEKETILKRYRPEPIPMTKYQGSLVFQTFSFKAEQSPKMSKNRRKRTINHLFSVTSIEQFELNLRILATKRLHEKQSQTARVIKQMHFQNPLKPKAGGEKPHRNAMHTLYSVKTVANHLFIWYDFSGSVYPFLGMTKHEKPPKCNFYVTDPG